MPAGQHWDAGSGQWVRDGGGSQGTMSNGQPFPQQTKPVVGGNGGAQTYRDGGPEGTANPLVDDSKYAATIYDPGRANYAYNPLSGPAAGFWQGGFQGSASNAEDANRMGQRSYWDAQQDRQGLRGVAQSYADFEAGRGGPSQAQVLARQSMEQGQANALGMAKSMRGGPSAGAMRAGVQAGTQMDVANTANSAALRAQEIERARQGQMQAYGQMGSLDAGLRGQSMAEQGQYLAMMGKYMDYGQTAEQNRIASQQARDQMMVQQQIAANQGNTQQSMQNAKSSSDSMPFAIGMGVGGLSLLSDANLKTDITAVGSGSGEPSNKSFLDKLKEQSEVKAKQDPNEAGNAWGNKSNAAAQGMNLMSAFGGLGGGGGLLSDKRTKNHIVDEAKPGDELHDLLRAINPVAYNYKNPADGMGRRVGLLAQDLERSEAGKSMVHDTPKGKVVDVGQAALSGLAAAADLDRRVKKLERV